MSTTVQEVFDITMDLYDERPDSGVLNPADVLAYQVRTPGIINLLQAELIKVGDIYKTFELSCSPIENILGYVSGFDIQQHGTSFPAADLIFEANKPCTAYSFEVDGEATIYIEDFTSQWNILATINVPDTVTSFTNYKGIVTPTAGATKSRLRFSGSYFYRTINRALFNMPLKASQVPAYAPWMKITTPADFKSVDQVISEYPERQYAKEANSKWENNKYYYVNYYYNGKIRINYRPIPIKLTAMTDIVAVDDITARTLLPYGLGAELSKEDNEEFYKHFIARYRELKMLSMVKPAAAEQPITDVFSTAYGG